MLANGEQVAPELRNLAHLPRSLVTEYKRMWAYGNHFRAEVATQGNNYLTYDSGVACVATTACQSSFSDTRLVEAQLKYIGVVRNILQVDYLYLKINLLVCSWIKPNVARNPNIKQDTHGFWLIKDGAFEGPRAKPYLLLVHASQIFLVPDRENPQWSVVVQKEPRSRRVEEDYDDGVLGAPGFTDPVLPDCTNEAGNHTDGRQNERGYHIRVQEVHFVDAEQEAA
ncbi:hypothetical protein M758_UG105300 [Ceratodon purpureus]|nr:hypothetical protein M758_UG105300 [Ceratodon purpureus]